MISRVLFSAGLVLLTACASARGMDEPTHLTLDAPAEASLVSTSGEFTPTQAARVAQAIQRANEIIADSMFVSLLRDMEASRAISWPRKSLELLPRSARAHPTAWLLARFAREGNYTMNDIGARNFPNELTTASTAPCVPFDRDCLLETDLGIRYVDAAPVEAIANTLVHERVHSFGQKHANGQSRRRNLCDASYIVGDMAELLLRRRDAGAPVTPRERLCPALYKRLKADGIVT